MNCTEALSWIGPMVDGVVDDATRSSFFAHLDSCLSCKRSYELEVVAKSLVQSSVPFVSTPIDVRRAVLSSISEEAERRSRSWLSRIFAAVPAPAYGLVAAAALIVYLFLPSPQSTVDDLIRHSAENDVMHQAAENFAMIREGKLKPTMVSCSPESMYGYLHAQHLPFDALVRPLDHCEGYAALVNEYHGVKLAHVVYTIGNDILYIYQVERNEALEGGGHLTMPPAAKQALRTSGWYTDPQHTDCNLVVWEEGGTICAATSTMPKTRMLAMLATH